MMSFRICMRGTARMRCCQQVSASSGKIMKIKHIKLMVPILWSSPT